ncbi:GIY-YIG nuclease family protein [Staphylococcus agnetis]|uniref:GIY-YIG nuclease family protein n=1 Tax=Staphylococcus agnetis TaxID=985762 RepID=UPI00208E0DC9|nr:GIY-YIG nuclease family protein [Staphylococcus agnetis]MCO4346324.1 GIY-YIG nuclease family protein [Staphylococcus agnetis]MCO4360600.1 GIY-YIG nuclease family protein [Staphylococcus agnetis]
MFKHSGLYELNTKYQSLKIEKDHLERENKHLRQEVEALKFELQQAIDLPLEAITLEQFRLRYLRKKETMETMPPLSGIYAYFNPTTDQIYIGQSKNMKRRLQQHFRQGSIKLSGHDCQFVNNGEWTYHVLDFIDSNDKRLLDEREAYWIAVARVAISPVYDYRENTPKILQRSGSIVNKTRGNNINGNDIS